jgi:hypothetical protein
MLSSKKEAQKTKKTTEPSNTNALNQKERLALKRQKQQAAQKLVSSVVAAILLAAVAGLAVILTVGVKPGVLVGLGTPILVLSFRYPRQALWAFLIYMPFSGTIVYSSIGQGNTLFQLAKDILYFPALFGLIYECNRKRLPILIPKKLIPTLGILLFSCFLTLFIVNGMQEFLPDCSTLSDAEQFLRDANGEWIINSTTGNAISTPCKSGNPFMQGVLGLKILLGYAPLIFCAHYLIEDKKKLLFFGRLLVVVAIICCVLGLMQYWMLKTGRCKGTEGLGASGLDLFKPNLDAKCLVGGSLLYSPSQGVIRLPGTFVSPWHWAWFLVGNAVISYTVAFSDISRFWRIVGMAGMALTLINAVVCGQRLAFGLVPAMFVILAILTGQVANLKRFIPLGIGLAIVLFFGFSFFNPDFIQERIDSFVGRWNNSPPHIFIQNQFNFALENQGGFLGQGLGKATNGARLFGPVSLIETFHPKVFFEIGILGFLAFMGFLTHLVILAFQSYWSVRDRTLRNFGSSLWVFILIISYLPYWYPLDTDPVAVYYWLFAGIIFKLPEIDKQEQAAAKILEEEMPVKKKQLLTSRRKN